jgi:hypothetical protein
MGFLARACDFTGLDILMDIGPISSSVEAVYPFRMGEERI